MSRSTTGSCPRVFGEAADDIVDSCRRSVLMEGSMESAPYGRPRVVPLLLRHIPLFPASVMLGEKTLEKGLGIATPKRDSRMSGQPAAGTFDARAAYERRVAEMDSETRRGSSGESWVQDPRSSI